MDDRSNTTGPEYSGRPATDTLAGLHRDVNTQSQLEPQKIFATRHVGPRRQDIFKMLHPLGFSSLEELTEAVIPSGIRLRQPLRLPPPESEDRVLEELEALAAENEVRRSFIGLGYHECITPPVIQRNILENPGWYTQYTPYQAEISQGRLEALLNFQTMISDLTGMSIANASLLDEATAAAEAMSMCYHLKGGPGRQTLLVASDCYPQTIAVIKTRAKPLGLKVEVVHHQNFNLSPDVFAILLQYPSADGAIHDYLPLVNRAHEANALVIVAADLLSLALLRPPGEFGADVVVGNSQRFGVSPGFGGPHAAFFATRDVFKRQMPGRLVGVSHDSQGKPALRLALQTREQHIRREKATSNICTAQVLLAIMASMYAVYHGPEGLRRIAGQIHHLSRLLAAGLKHLGYGIGAQSFFDTIQVELKTETSASVQTRAAACGFNLRMVDENTVGISLGETARREDVIALLRIFQPAFSAVDSLEDLAAGSVPELPAVHRRQSPFLTHKVFNRYHSETEMMRYLKRLESYDLSLTRSMIPLGSCTMKLNPAAAMLPVTWPRFSRLHPYAPSDQTRGYQQLFHQLTEWLAEITGLEAVSLQPNAGSQGEYSGLLVIHAY
ncbi:MAG TPA: glycine dehydrogenase (aminomethyl-transferring), partial [Candidatus Paceibacterota bacterium]|nr:glycine dehydrogenase (aminomethyl-transferring) [Candidatus Paceibacterota bacterium]